MEINKILNFTLLSVKPYNKNEDYPTFQYRNITIFLFLSYIFLLFIAEFGVLYFLKLLKIQQRKRYTEMSNIKSVSILSVMKTFIKCRFDLQHTIRSLVNTYGLAWKVSLFGVKECVFLHDPGMLQKLFMSSEPGHLHKPTWLYSKILMGPLQAGLTSSRANIWKSHRTAVCKGFSYSNLQNQVKLFNKYGNKLVNRLNDELIYAKLSSEFNGGIFSRIIHETALEIISHIASGKEGILNLDEIKTFHDNFYKFKKLTSYRVYHPWLLPNILWSLHPRGKELHKAIRITEDLGHKICRVAKEENLKIREKIREGDNFVSNVDNIVSLVDEMVKNGLSDEEIYQEIYTFLTTGHETVSMTLNLTLFHLAANAEYQKNCQEEVDNLFFEMKAADQSEISMKALSELKYLDRCVKEELRLYPTTPIIGRQIDSPIALDDKTTLPAGTTILTSLWLLHRNQDYFPDPESFNPDRFQPENSTNRRLCEYMPFATGPRNCLGWKSGTLEVKLLAAYILHNFELSTNITVGNVKDAFEKCIWPPPELPVLLKRRR